MTSDFSTAIARILGPNGKTAGTGYVVSVSGLIVTCSHVIQDEAAQKRGDPLPQSVDVVFVNEAKGNARVHQEWWSPATEEDVAILSLDSALPMHVVPLALGSSTPTAGHKFHSRGFRLFEQFPSGLYSEGTIQGRISYRGRDALQLLTNQIDQGMSGAPVVDVKRQRVVG